MYKILLVEDDPTITEVLERSLQNGAMKHLM